MKHLTILGSTGSIGTQTLDVVSQHSDEFQVVALTAGKNITLLEAQIRQFTPQYACLWEEADAVALREKLGDCDTIICYGMAGLIELATLPQIDVVVAAMVGMIGLQPVMEAIKAKKDIALANKETLVTAGHLIMPLAKENHVNILPVDSEHSAIFQCLQGVEGEKKQLDKILLTASGGPFRLFSQEQIQEVTVEDALKHPNWEMGKKITIDSSTMINKGLEVLEAKWLFDVEFDQIEVLVQPQSIIHSMVQFVDGAVIAQLGTPDMRLPIQYALTYPERWDLEGERLDFSTLSQIQFAKPNPHLKGLSLAYQAGRIGGTMPTVMNAANEYAVARFLEKTIGFQDIFGMIEYAMDQHQVIPDPSLDIILQTEKETYQILSKYRR